MANEEYLIPLGLDASGVPSASNQIIAELKKVQDAAKESGATLSGVFGTARQAQEKMISTTMQASEAERLNLEATKSLAAAVLTLSNNLSVSASGLQKNTSARNENSNAASAQSKVQTDNTNSLQTNTEATNQNTKAQKDNQNALAQTAKPAQAAKKEWNGLQNSVNQLTRELPAGAVGLNTFFLAISNNIPGLADEIGKIRKENEALSASGTKGVPVWKQLAGAFLSWNTLLSVGVTLLTLYGKDIVDFVKSLFSGKDAIDKAKLSLEALNDAFKSSSIKNAIENFTTLTDHVKLAKQGLIDKDAVVKEYNETMGKTTGIVSSVGEVEEKLTKAGPSYIQMVTLKAKAQAAFALAASKSVEAQLLLAKPPEEAASGWQKFGASTLSLFEGLFIGLDKTSKNYNNVVKEVGKTAQKEQSDQLNKSADFLNKIGKQYESEAASIASKTKGFNFFGDNDKLLKQEETNQKRLEDARKKQEAAAEKARQEELKAQENFTNALNKMQKEAAEDDVKAIQDETFKATAAENQRFVQQLRDAKKFYDDSMAYQEEHNKNVEDKKEKESQLTEAYNRVIENANAAHINKLAQIDAEGFLKEQRRIQEYNREVLQIQNNQKGIEIASEQEKWENLRNKMNREGNLTVELDKEISEARNKAIADINIKWSQKELDQQHEIDSSMNQAFQSNSLSSEALQRQKRQNQLNIDIDYYKKSLALAEAALLKDPTNKELEVQIAKMKEAIASAQKDLKDMSNDAPDLWSALGINEDGEKQIKKYLDAVATIGQVTSDLFGAIADGYQNQIDAKQKQIDALDSQISDQEQLVDKEKQLQDDGYANNVDGAETELERLKSIRAQNQKDLEEVQKKQEAAQKAKIISDTLAQASNLITSATQIFEAFSSIPFVGVPLAIAAIGTMFSAFAIAKVNAWKAVGSSNSNSSTTTYAKGGIAKGKRHSQGGNKYQSMDGNDSDILEIEMGEYVINRKSTDKYKSLLDAINEDRVPDFNKKEAIDYLTNVRYTPQKAISETISDINFVNAQKYSENKSSSKDSKQLEEINSGIKQLNNKEDISIVDLGDYIEIKEGNHTKRIKKNKG